MVDDEVRSRAARRAAERALVRVVHHYGARPEFVVLGGLVPELLCAASDYEHAGTTDIDVQVDLEIDVGAVNAARLEQALRDAEFEPDSQRIWRWRADELDSRMVVRFELLADLGDEPAEAEIQFDGCESLGAANLRGTGFASQDVEIRELRGRVGDEEHAVEVNVTGLAGFLLAKCAAAHSRRKAKDWYDLAFVLLHNDAGGPAEAADAVIRNFGDGLASVRASLDDLRANFADPAAQGPQAYAEQVLVDHPNLDRTTLLADAVVAVATFYGRLVPRQTATETHQHFRGGARSSRRCVRAAAVARSRRSRGSNDEVCLTPVVQDPLPTNWASPERVECQWVSVGSLSDPHPPASSGTAT